MTKADLVERVYEKLGTSKQESARLVEEVFEIIKSTLEAGENVKISGFGKFTLRSKGARPGRNLRTREQLIIAPRRVVTFKASHILKARVNQGA